MRKLLSLVLAFACIAESSYAEPQSPSATWGSSPTFRDANDRAVDRATAEAIQRSRNGGYGPAQSVVNGDIITNNNCEGDCTSNSSSTTNAVNYTSNSSSTSLTDSPNANVGINYRTGASSNGVNQSATSQVNTANGSLTATGAAATH